MKVFKQADDSRISDLENKLNKLELNYNKLSAQNLTDRLEENIKLAITKTTVKELEKVME